MPCPCVHLQGWGCLLKGRGRFLQGAERKWGHCHVPVCSWRPPSLASLESKAETNVQGPRGTWGGAEGGEPRRECTSHSHGLGREEGTPAAGHHLTAPGSSPPGWALAVAPPGSWLGCAACSWAEVTESLLSFHAKPAQQPGVRGWGGRQEAGKGAYRHLPSLQWAPTQRHGAVPEVNSDRPDQRAAGPDHRAHSEGRVGSGHDGEQVPSEDAARPAPPCGPLPGP